MDLVESTIVYVKDVPMTAIRSNPTRVCIDTDCGQHPHFSPSETWRHLFDLAYPSNSPEDPAIAAPASPDDLQATAKTHRQFTPSTVPSHKLILRLLAENPPKTITILAIGPMTNLALAAAEDATTLLRAKEIVVMGGAIDLPGNITPFAEFNTHADTIAFARVLALTSPYPKSTMPPWPPGSDAITHLPGYPTPLPGQLKVRLCALDITTSHVLPQHLVDRFADAWVNNKGEKSPLAQWLQAILQQVWPKVKETGGLSLHDPLAVYHSFYARDQAGKNSWTVEENRDIRVETVGQWTRGACVIDRRHQLSLQQEGKAEKDMDKEVSGDRGGWLDERKGNRVDNVIGSPFWKKGEKRDEKFAETLLGMVFPQ